MGGPGAYVVLDMGVDTPIVNGTGPDLEVREIGTANGGVDEEYRVLVSNSTDPASFVLVGIGSAFSLLDIAGTGLSSARYVRLEDLSTRTQDDPTPGSDIESVTSLHTGASSRPPVTGLSRTLTASGTRLSWTPMTGTDVLGYSIRRSTDGIHFNSTANWTVSALEYAFLDTQIMGGEFWYAVSVRYTSGESPLQIVHAPAATLGLYSQTEHLGDNSVASWQVPSPAPKLTLSFNLAEVPRGPTVRMNFDLFDVDYSTNIVIINGYGRRSLPTQSAESWRSMSVDLESGLFLPGQNTIEIYSRDSGGGLTGNRDDLQIRNISLTWHTLP